MADSMGIDVTEIARVAVDLGRKRDTAGRLVSIVIRKTAFDIQATAQKLAPFDTGALRSSIGVTFPGIDALGVFSAEIGPTVNYAAYVEEGTSRHGPQPFLRPAVNNHEAAFIAALAKVTEGTL